MIRKVIVGISGGIDSAVATALLKHKGYDVSAVFMKNWDLTDELGNCSIDADWDDAQWVCQRVGVPINQINFVKDYWNDIFGQFIRDYETGLTPNPDILCNRHIKFDSFFKYCKYKRKGDAIATGHYARSTFGPYLEHKVEGERVKLLRGIDPIKDQTFFLCQINQEALQNTMFPLGGLNKTQVKRIASDFGLDRIIKKRESMGICFVGNRNFKDFIAEYIEKKPGDFIDIDTGKIVGRHCGIHEWTYGQRCRIGGVVKPYFIMHKDTAKNNIFVAAGTDHPDLYTNFLFTDQPQWIDQCPNDIAHGNIFRCHFRFQHTKPIVDCWLIPAENGGLMIKLYRPLRAITPGQYAVFYLDDECLGAARILQPGPSMKYSIEFTLDDLTVEVNKNLKVNVSSLLN